MCVYLVLYFGRLVVISCVALVRQDAHSVEIALRFSWDYREPLSKS